MHGLRKTVQRFLAPGLLLALVLLLASAAHADTEEVRIGVGTPVPSPTMTPKPTPGPTPVPTPSPVPTPTPVPTATPEPTPVRKLIALTFDDGPNKEVTPGIVDILEEYGVKATFFMIGRQIKGKEEIVRRIAAAGHEIGCHTWNHGNMTKESQDRQIRDFRTWKDTLDETLGYEYPVSVLRPPGGSTNSRARRVAKELGCTVILWSVDTADWSNRNAKKILSIVQKNAKDGDIILMHDRIAATRRALPQIIEFLQEEGFELVTVSELLARSGESPAPGTQFQRMPAQ